MKYSIHSTKADWENLYAQVAKFPELDVKKFKKSTNFDGAAYAFLSFLRREKGISHEQAKIAYPIYCEGQTIKAVAN